MLKIPPTTSCKLVFKKENILALPSLYISQLIVYVNENNMKFPKNADTIHSYKTPRNLNVHYPFSRLNIAQQDPAYIGVKYFFNFGDIIDIDEKIQ